MTAAPTDPYIFHITHVANLAGILSQGGLWSDGQLLARNVRSTNIGYLHIKQRRMNRPVATRAGGVLGDYVPFNFCPRSVMLYVVSRGHDDYQGSQADVLHLVSRVSIATNQGRPWAFSDRHAELSHALHFDDLGRLGAVPWHVMTRATWADVKEERQAEFLVRDFFPWTAVIEVATMNHEIARGVQEVLNRIPHQPPVVVRPEWYY